MLQSIEKNDVRIWQGDAMPLLAAVALLSALEPAWEVEEAVDPAGERSIVVFSAVDDRAMPAFVLFEKAGMAVIATVRNDVWESEREFASCVGAAAAIVMEATRADMPGATSDEQHCERYA
jgi:hypothetical protein